MRKRGSGRPRNDEREARQEAILQAATELFLEYGYERTTTDEIARRANASKQTIYSLYPSKSELFGALMKRLAGARIEEVAVELPPNAPAREVLIQFGLKILRNTLSERGLRVQKMLRVQKGYSKDLAEAWWDNGPGRGRRVISAYLRSQVALKQLSIENIEFATEQFLGSVLGGTALRADLGLDPMFPNDEELTKYVGSSVEAFLRAYDRSNQSG